MKLLLLFRKHSLDIFLILLSINIKGIQFKKQVVHIWAVMCFSAFFYGHILVEMLQALQFGLQLCNLPAKILVFLLTLLNIIL